MAGPDGKCQGRSLAARGLPFIPIPKPITVPKPIVAPKPIPRPVIPVEPKPVIPDAPPPPKPAPEEPPAPAPKPNCKRADCAPGAPGDGPGKRPHSPEDDNPNKKPNTEAGPAGKSGEDIHNDLVAAIRNNKAEVNQPLYTEKGLKRDEARAGATEEFPVSSEDVRDLFKSQGFRTEGNNWKPAVMDNDNYDFASFQRGRTPDSESSGSSAGSGEYAAGIPQVDNYHDVAQGNILVKNQVKVADDASGLPWSEKAYQLVREDFGANPVINKIGVTGIISDTWRAAATKHLGNVPDGQWQTYQRGTPQYNDFLATDNGKWAGFMMADHHTPLGGKDIASLSVVKKTQPDGDVEGYMVMNLGPVA